MYITASKIYHLPVASLGSNSKVGEVNLIFFSPDDFTIMALEVTQGNFIFKKKLYLANADIIDLDKNGVVIKGQDSLVEKDEIIRIQKLIKSNTPIYGQKAVTKSNKYLGKITDLLIDSQSLTISRFYISNLLDERILPMSRVEKATSQAVIFSDEIINQTPMVETEGAAA